MADLQAALSEAVKLNQSLTQFLKFSAHLVGYKGLPMDGLRVRVRSAS